jgi:hypothetical protein
MLGGEDAGTKDTGPPAQRCCFDDQPPGGKGQSPVVYDAPDAGEQVVVQFRQDLWVPITVSRPLIWSCAGRWTARLVI